MESDATGTVAELDLDDGSLVFYDREQHTAWLQSSVSITVEDVR